MATIRMQLSSNEVMLLLNEALMGRGFVLAPLREPVRLRMTGTERRMPSGEPLPPHVTLEGADIDLAVSPIATRNLPELELYPAEPQAMRRVRVDDR